MPIIKQCDLFILPSHYEGWGLVIMEADIFKLPVVATDVGGLRNVVGGAGLLFPHGDEIELAKKVCWLCEHPDEYKEVAIRCQERAKHYDISHTVDQYLDLYKKLCSV